MRFRTSRPHTILKCYWFPRNMPALNLKSVVGRSGRGHPFWGEFRDTRLKSLEGDVELSRELQQSSKMLSCRDEVRAANDGIVHLLNFGTRTLITPNGVASVAAPAARKFSIYSLKIRIHQEMVDGRESHSRLTRKRNEPCVRDVYAPNLTTTVQGFTRGGP